MSQSSQGGSVVADRRYRRHGSKIKGSPTPPRGWCLVVDEIKSEGSTSVKRNLLHHQERYAQSRYDANTYGKMLHIIVPSTLTTITCMTQ